MLITVKNEHAPVLRETAYMLGLPRIKGALSFPINKFPKQ